jgi:hypothetical protein
MTLRELLERYGVDIAALLDSPLGERSLDARRALGRPQAYTQAVQTWEALEVRITVPLFDGKAAPPARREASS